MSAVKKKTVRPAPPSKRAAGVISGPDSGFSLPGEGRRAPDAAFVVQERWDAVPEAQREKLAPLCPDFVVELRPDRTAGSALGVRSASDRVARLQEKVQEYLRAGLRLGWLIDPFEEKVCVYRPGEEVQVVASFDETLSGEDVLLDFLLQLDMLR